MEYEYYDYKETLYIEVEEYCNGNTALILYTEDGEPFADLTVNLDILMPGYAFIDTNNLSGAKKLMSKYKLGKPTGTTRQSGFCEYPLYELNMKNIEKYKFPEAE